MGPPGTGSNVCMLQQKGGICCKQDGPCLLLSLCLLSPCLNLDYRLNSLGFMGWFQVTFSAYRRQLQQQNRTSQTPFSHRSPLITLKGCSWRIRDLWEWHEGQTGSWWQELVEMTSPPYYANPHLPIHHNGWLHLSNIQNGNSDLLGDILALSRGSSPTQWSSHGMCIEHVLYTYFR